MVASDLREWIALVIPDLVPDGQGGMREQYPITPPITDTPANVVQDSGDEVFSADQKQNLYRYTVTIRFQDGVSSAQRIYWRGQWLDILSVENVDERDAWLKFAAERNNAGQQ